MYDTHGTFLHRTWTLNALQNRNSTKRKSVRKRLDEVFRTNLIEKYLKRKGRPASLGRNFKRYNTVNFGVIFYQISPQRYCSRLTSEFKEART